jgi:transcriptional regulator with XRE-family HTH domain
MEQDDDNRADLAWLEGFRGRLKQARGERSQEDMAYLLGITRDAYSKYEGSRGTVIPTRLLPRFCKICAVRIEWLIEGDREPKQVKLVPARPKGANRA